jgi:hypothetical protein
MAYWEHLDLDEKTRKALEIRDQETRKKKIKLLFFLLIILFISYLLSSKGFITKQTFELIFSAFIGGFIGSAFSFIILSDK